MSDSELTIDVPQSLAGQRIDRVVALLLEVSRNVANEVLTEELVSVDGAVVVKPSFRVELGQVVTMPATVEPTEIEPDHSVDVDVVFEDEHVIVVDKPAGLVVHPGAGVATGTLVQGVLACYPEIASVGQRGRPGIVHRLDKGTSGLLMVARSPLAYTSLTEQLRDRLVKRRYLALVQGEPQSQHGVIDAPIGRSLRHPTRQAVRPDGKHARTAYEVLERFDLEGSALALLRFELETGRTHQIRVHADAIGIPLVGDDRYGDRRPPVVEVQRPLLHAMTLGFERPLGEWSEFTSPLPDDFTRVLRRLGSSFPSG